MRDIIRNLFTGKDGSTFDVGRVLWGSIALSFICLSGWHTFHAGIFDPVAWGTGAGAVLASGGAAIGLKAHTEPGA